MIPSPVTREESVAASLRALFSRYGYQPFRMNKFEDYDLYVRFKDYLLSESVITFPDGERLLALKPDVTLSIIRSFREGKGRVQKVYYQENVYRRLRPAEPFRELLQTGLECIGDLDELALGEVLTLAARALAAVPEESILAVGHLGLLSAFIDRVTEDPLLRGEILHLVGAKNMPGIRALAREKGLDPAAAEDLVRVLSLVGSPGHVLPQLQMAADDVGAGAACAELARLLEGMEEPGGKCSVRVDLSAVSDGKYYNGLVFRGFVKGLPERVLAGGQYDGLMARMGKNARAVGFAVYLDQLSLLETDPGFDADVLILYDDTVAPAAVREAAARLREEGKSVLVLPARPRGGRYKEVLKLGEAEVTYCD